MKKTTVFHALRCSSLLAICIPGACTDKAVGIPGSAPPVPHDSVEIAVEPLALETLCNANETAAFSGDVHDGFGLTISVCLSAETEDEVPVISIRSIGEGGSTVLSCKADACGGIINFEHYRRYRFSILTLEWEQDGSRQQLVESFDAEELMSDPKHTVTHTWSTKEARSRGIEPEAYPVLPVTAPLSLLTLEDVLGDQRQ